MSLTDWLNEGHLRQHKTSRNETSQLMAVFERDMADAQLEAISADRRFATAYNAMLTIATAALVASGYRSAGEGHHYWVIQSLAFTLELDTDTIEAFNRFRRKRNTIDYERIDAASEQEVSEMLKMARNLGMELEKWLRKNHPRLI